MTKPDTILDESEPCLVPASLDSLSLSFLEEPTAALLDRDLSQMTDEEILALVAETRVLTNEPGALVRRIRDESVAIKTGTKPKRKKQEMDKLMNELL